MHNITVSDDIYQSITELAIERGQTVEQLLADLLAEKRWEDHATRAYDAYHERGRGPGEVLSDEEFFNSDDNSGDYQRTSANRMGRT
jgi:hypothetical protein